MKQPTPIKRRRVSTRGSGRYVAWAAPTPFTIGQWALDDVPSEGGDTLGITLSAIPAGTSAVWVSINGAAAVLLTGSPATGIQYPITVPATTLASIRIFAANAAGLSAPSDTKTETPTASGATSLFDFELLTEAGSSTITSVPNLRVSIDSGTTFYALGSVPGHTLTIARGGDGKSLVISGWTDGTVPAGLMVHYEQRLPEEPNNAANAGAALFARKVGDSGPVNTTLPSGYQISATVFESPVGVS